MRSAWNELGTAREFNRSDDVLRADGLTCDPSLILPTRCAFHVTRCRPMTMTMILVICRLRRRRVHLLISVGVMQAERGLCMLQ
jgi:hypothetical protein